MRELVSKWVEHWRIEYEGALNHLISRGADGLHIFIDDIDRNLFLKTIDSITYTIINTYRDGRKYRLAQKDYPQSCILERGIVNSEAAGAIVCVGSPKSSKHAGNRSTHKI